MGLNLSADKSKLVITLSLRYVIERNTTQINEVIDIFRDNIQMFEIWELSKILTECYNQLSIFGNVMQAEHYTKVVELITLINSTIEERERGIAHE